MKWPTWFFGKKEQALVDTQIVLKGSRVLGELLKIWPELNPGRLWLADSVYVMPTEKELKEILFRSKVDSYKYTKNIQDCDDYALFLHTDVILYRYENFKKGKIDKDQLYSWAFGQIWYKDSRIGYHAINICITRDKGVLLIEPQNDKIFKPKKDITIRFIRM